MALTVTDLITQCLTDLQDDGTRWPRAELLGYYNAAQRQLAELRPDQVAQVMELALVAGHRQELPAGALSLLEITHNTGRGFAAVTRVDVALLDAVQPGWRALRGGRAVAHYIYNLQQPYEFQVYPPVADTPGVQVAVSARVAVAPADLASESEAPTVPLRWMDALRHFVLFRAYTKDAETGSAQLAAQHLQLFQAALGAQSQAAEATAPPV